MNYRYLIKKVLLLSTIFLAPFSSNGQAGSLDNSFDFDGIVTTPVGGISSQCWAMAIQNDNKIVAVGWNSNGTNTSNALVRYKVDGSLDSTFDSDGIVTTSITTGDCIGFAIAIESNGKIITTGFYGGGTVGVYKYNANGTLDSTFDGDGIAKTDVSATLDAPYSIALQTDGKILIAGHTKVGSKSNFLVVRYTTSGSLDSTFDADGIVTTSISTTNDIARCLKVQSDGKILVSGSSASNLAILRYNTNGSLDSTFDVDGIVTISFGNVSSSAQCLAIQSDGKIVVSGNSSNNATMSDFLWQDSR